MSNNFHGKKILTADFINDQEAILFPFITTNASLDGINVSAGATPTLLWNITSLESGLYKMLVNYESETNSSTAETLQFFVGAASGSFGFDIRGSGVAYDADSTSNRDTRFRAIFEFYLNTPSSDMGLYAVDSSLGGLTEHSSRESFARIYHVGRY